MIRRPVLLPALAAVAALLYAQVLPAPRSPDPVPYRSADGKISGWKISIPGRRPLATPAVVDGQVFLGGGFGSHEFYSLDALTGKLQWTYHTADDGPTAAVVSDGKVVFNTESCELEIITRDGKPVWKKWLGDPLMSMPAIADGTVYMAFPDSHGDARYYLAAFDLNTGREQWKYPIASEIITAPVIDGDRVYLSSVDGTLVAFDRRNGTKIWSEQRNATSAPAVWRGQVYLSRREATKVTKNGATVTQQNEAVAVQRIAPLAPARVFTGTERQADYLDYTKRASASKIEVLSQSLDSSVGFASAKGSANMMVTRANLGQGSVHGIWAYQGSKPFIDHGRIYTSMGNTVLCTDAESGKVLWKRAFYEDKSQGLLDSALTPPAIVNGKLFIGSSFGEVLALSAETGDTLWSADVGEPVVFQPAVAGGNVYVPTNNGTLLCLKTGDSRNDGWLMWGANSAHNGLGPH